MKPGYGMQQLQQAQRDAQARAQQQQEGWAWGQKKKQDAQALQNLEHAAIQRAAFLKAEASAANLRAQHAAGAIDDAAFEKALQGLMLTDDQGQWWMVGQNSGEWYRSDGQAWHRDQPLSLFPDPASEHISQDTLRKGHPFLAVLAFIILIAIFGVLGMAAGSFVAANIDNGPPSFIALFVVWGFGFLFSLAKAKRIWRG